MIIDYSGQTFGNLTVVKRMGLFEFPDRQNKCGRHTVTSIWKCKCVCGREVEVKTDMLKRSKTTCGNPECQAFIDSFQLVFWEPITEGDITKIPLGNSDKFALIDTEDLDKVKNRSWVINRGYVLSKRMRKTLRLHRVITNAPDGFDVDHINHDKLDNRKLNLRICTRSQNQFNSVRRKDNKTGLKGIIYNKKTKKFQARIRCNNEIIFLGCFDTAEDAVEARKQAEIIHHKEYRFKGGQDGTSCGTLLARMPG